MEMTASHHNEVVKSEYLDDSDSKNLPFDTPADIERYWTLAAQHIKSDFVIEGGTPLVDVDLEDKPPRKLLTEIVQMELASASGYLAAVEAVYQLWQATPQDHERAQIEHFASSFAVAMAHDQVSVASYLFKARVPMNHGHVELAIEQKSYSFLQLFLDYGYNINESPDWTTPRPLLWVLKLLLRGISTKSPLAFQDEALTRWLLDRGANQNVQCVLDLTPLSIAMCYAPFSTIEMLFRYGRSIELGQLLHHAVRRVLADRIKVANYILDMGPPINDIMYQH